MDHNEFINNMEKASSGFDKETALQIIKNSFSKIQHNEDGTINLVIVMEELAELQQQLSKYIRGKADFECLVEELGDVMLGVYYVQEICGISDEMLHKAMNVKLERQDKRNEKHVLQTEQNEENEENEENEPITFMCPSCGRIYEHTSSYVKYDDGRRTRIYCPACAKYIKDTT